MTSHMNICIRAAQNKQEMDQVIDLRRKVFCNEQGFSKELIHDDKDQHGLVLVATNEGKVIASSRICFEENISKFEFIVVENNFRRQGLGTNLIDKMTQISREKMMVSCKLKGQSRLTQFYESNGFSREGSSFTIEGVDHHWFLRRLDNTPLA